MATHELTPRQRDVLRLVLEGRGNKWIAHELGCHLKTVEYTLGMVSKRAGVPNNRVLIAVWAVKNGYE